MEIELSSGFLKKAKKLSKREKSILSERVGIFRKDPKDMRLKTHALTGKLGGLFSFSVNYSTRVIFIYLETNKVLLIDVGSHDEVYR